LGALHPREWTERALSDLNGPPFSSYPLERQTRGDSDRDWSGLSAPQRYHEATKLVAADGAGEPQPPRIPPATPLGRRSAAPDAGAAPASTVHSAIRARRSARHFEAAPMRRDSLLSILALAQRNAALCRCAGLELYLVAHRVTETPVGLYRYGAAQGHLERLRGGDLAGSLVRACLGQAKAGEAAAALIGVAQLAEATARGGARSYRDLLLEAGATAQRIYLGAEALGLAARNLAAFYDDALDALLGLDGQTPVAVHLTALGPGD
jgi:SagB-type dehydrogenase family enzyme